MTTDTIADMLTRIRNANLAKHKIVKIPATKVTRNIAQLLYAEGLIGSFRELKNGSGVSSSLNSTLILSLKYKYIGKERKPNIEKIQRISKPGLRVYSGAKKIPRILGGFGIAIVSTSSGLMTDNQARKAGIGGELLCYIW
jgi:small subunit ribosomal protein S8